MPSLLWKADLNRGPVLVAAGRSADGRGDVAAALGSQVFVFAPEDGEYLPYAGVELNAPVTGLAPGPPGLIRENGEYFAASSAERIFLLGVRQGAAAVLAGSDPEPGAGFADVAAGDLDGDGRGEIVAAASGPGAIFVYRPEVEPGFSLDLVGIRVVSGTPRFVEIMERPGLTPAMAVAFEQQGKTGLALFFLTERGFEAGPVLEGLSFGITGLAAGNFTGRAGSELALGGPGGMIWLVGNGEKLEVIAVTDSLGTSVSALAASEGETSRLAAGTPEGYVFVFNYPVKKSPDLAFGVREGISGLAVLPRERVAAGTALGGVQVWSLAGGDPEKRYIVGPGDTLWSIAGRFGVTVDQILAVNQGIMNRDLILPGQIIRIPLPR